MWLQYFFDPSEAQGAFCLKCGPEERAYSWHTRAGLLLAHCSGPTAGKESGPTAGNKSGPTAGEKSGPTAGKKSGLTAGEKSGPTAGKKSGPTAGEKSGPTAGKTKPEELLRNHWQSCTPEERVSWYRTLASALNVQVDPELLKAAW